MPEMLLLRRACEEEMEIFIRCMYLFSKKRMSPYRDYNLCIILNFKCFVGGSIIVIRKRVSLSLFDFVLSCVSYQYKIPILARYILLKWGIVFSLYRNLLLCLKGFLHPVETRTLCQWGEV